MSTASAEEVLLTEDVSFSGVFVRTDAVRPARQLVQVRLALPTTERELSITAGVVHVVAPGPTLPRIAGMGLRFRALDAATRERWDAFIRSCAARHETDPEHGLAEFNSFATLSHLEPIRRRFPRAHVELTLEVRTLEELHALVARDIGHGGTFVRGADDCPPGTPVKIAIHHPSSDDVLFVTGKVVRAVRRPLSERGLGVAFDELTSAQRSALDAFIGAAAHEPDAEVIIFEEDGA